MSWMCRAEPEITDQCPEEVDVTIVPRTVDIGGFEVHRALPFKTRRMVGPFIFWDQMGPGSFAVGEGVDVRPHPHIGLSTVTYLFNGSLDHKDSLGTDMRIVPGDVNVMTAGAGIVHSERTGKDIRQKSTSLFGIQSWLAQPQKDEGGKPGFRHFVDAEIPTFDGGGVSGKVVLGEVFGCRSPVPLQWETVYVDFYLKRGTTLEIPQEPEERALHLVEGRIVVGGMQYEGPQMLVLSPGRQVVVQTLVEAHLLLLGGAPMDSKRYIWWNFVGSSVDKIKEAAARWTDGEFDTVPGDEEEYIPLPDLAFPREEA